MVRARARLIMAGLTLGAVLVAGGATTAAAGERGYWSEAGLGAGAALTNVVYMPCKLAYAALGTITGGLTYALTGGSYETAENVWLASLGGSYVITPDMLTGKRPVEFSGTPTLRAASIVEETTPMSENRGPRISDSYVRDTYY